jgi:very-short-patch-repair endonuclease
MRPYIPDVGRSRRARSRAILWRELKGRQLGYAFGRDHPVDRYNVSFYCEALNLVVEIDGIVRDDRRMLRRCDRRLARLRLLGVAVLRFTDDEVVHNIDGVVGSIRRWIRNRPAGGHAAGRVETGMRADHADAGESGLGRAAPVRLRSASRSPVMRSVVK